MASLSAVEIVFYNSYSSYFNIYCSEEHENVRVLSLLLGSTGNGEIDFSEFVQMMKTQMKNRDVNQELMEAFQVFDCNKNGRIR